MNKFNFKSFISGFLICSILTFSFPVFATGISKSIKVLFNSVSVKIDGKNISGDKISYNGNVFVNSKNLADILGKDYLKDSNGNVIIQGKKSSKPSTNNTTKVNLWFGAIESTGDITLGTDKSYETKVEMNSIGTPELILVATNDSNKDIVSFEFTCKFYDSFGKTVYKIGTKDPIFKGVVQDAKLPKKKGENDTANWNVYSFNLVLYNLAYEVKTYEIKVTKIKFSDGTIWSAK